MAKFGRFKEDDAKRVAKLVRRYGNRKPVNWRRPRRRVTQPSSSTSTEDDGSFTCCECENSKLWIEAENAGIKVEKKTFPKSIVSGGLITHKAIITCLADDTTLEITLPALDCTEIDCQTLDLTGTMVGSCDVGVIRFGNSGACLTEVCTAPIAPNISDVWNWDGTDTDPNVTITLGTIVGGVVTLAATGSIVQDNFVNPHYGTELDIEIEFRIQNDFKIGGTTQFITMTFGAGTTGSFGLYRLRPSGSTAREVQLLNGDGGIAIKTFDLSTGWNTMGVRVNPTTKDYELTFNGIVEATNSWASTNNTGAYPGGQCNNHFLISASTPDINDAQTEEMEVRAMGGQFKVV